MLVCCIFVFAHCVSLLGFHGQAGLAADPLVQRWRCPHKIDGFRPWLHVVVFWTLPNQAGGLLFAAVVRWACKKTSKAIPLFKQVVCVRASSDFVTSY